MTASIPSGWRYASLGELCHRNTGNRDPREPAEESFVYVDISSIDNQAKRIVEPKIILGKDAPSRARQVLHTNDILVATTRPNLNAVAQVPSELDQQICSTGFCVLRPIETELDSDFLFSFVRSTAFVNALSDLVKGALYPAVTDAQVLGQGIPLPPLREQKRIAAILNEQMAAIETCRHAFSTQASKVQRLSVMRLKEMFWEIASSAVEFRPLAEIAALRPSRSVSTDGDAEVEVVTTASLTESGFSDRGIKSARMKARDVADCVLEPGEILIARSNTPELVGRAAMFPGNEKQIVAGDLTIRIESGPELLPEFLAGYLSYLYVTKYWTERAGGASGTMKKITRTQIEALEIPVPSLELQEKVIARLRAIAGVASNAVEAISQCSEAVASLPAAYLRKAFAGGL